MKKAGLSEQFFFLFKKNPWHVLLLLDTRSIRLLWLLKEEVKSTGFSNCDTFEVNKI